MDNQMKRDTKLCTPLDGGLLVMTHLMSCSEHQRWCYTQCVWDENLHKHIYEHCFTVQHLAIIGHLHIMQGAQPWKPKPVIAIPGSH